MKRYVIKATNQRIFYCYDGIVNYPHREPLFSRNLQDAVAFTGDAYARAQFNAIRQRSRYPVRLVPVQKVNGWLRFY